MDIEKLCEEFHEKIGKDKTVKITIEEELESLPQTNYVQATFNLSGNNKNMKPYMKVIQNDKVLHIYTGNFISNTK